jgi:trans-2-enoyl-CoA reductase
MFIQNENQLSKVWKNSLAHQIPMELPDYETVKNELLKLFKNHFNQYSYVSNL